MRPKRSFPTAAAILVAALLLSACDGGARTPSDPPSATPRNKAPSPNNNSTPVPASASGVNATARVLLIGLDGADWKVIVGSPGTELEFAL